MPKNAAKSALNSRASSASQAGKQSRLLVHPLFLFTSVWAVTFLMYAMHLSGLLILSTNEVGRIVMWIVVPFVAAYMLFSLLYALSPKTTVEVAGNIAREKSYIKKVERNLDLWFRGWIVLTLVEVAFSGGVPLLWIITGSTKSYVDFGLPVVHVFVGSLLSVLALAKFGLYLLHGEKRRLFIPIFQLLWSVVIVSRGLMISALVQGAILWFCIKGTNIKMVLRTLVIVIVAILMFGYAGDSRSTGLSTFRDLAQPAANYPEWLPSGVLWVYVYITTPLGNLAYTSLHSKPSYDALFPSTTYYSFPTVVRNFIYGKNSDLGSGGDLVNESLNVSSAYIGPLKDYGYIGIACFSLLMSVLSAYFWKQRKSLKGQILYSIMGQCLLFSIFWNFLFYNPFLGQYFWVYLLFSATTLRVFPRRSPISKSIASPEL